MIKQMVPYKKGSRFYIKMYGIEYELILPKEEVEEGSKKRKTNKKEKLVKKVVK